MSRKKRCFAAVLLSLFSFGMLWAADVDVAKEAGKRGMDLYWDPLSQNCVIEKDGSQVSFLSGAGFVLRGNDVVVQEKAPSVKDGKLVTTASFMNEIDRYLNGDDNPVPDVSVVFSDSGKYTGEIGKTYSIGAILIDPGHGGKDPGASSKQVVNGKQISVVEKDINLKIGRMLYDILKSEYPSKQILMTRNSDVFLTLEERTNIANSVKLSDSEAVLYVSIHVNASIDKSAKGYEVWYLSPGYRRHVIDANAVEDKAVLSILNSMMEEEYTTESILMAKFIQEGIQGQVGVLSQSRGIKEEEWFVVRNVKMPSVLVETGFLTNTTEALLLSDDSYLKKISLGIYNGLKAFVIHFERSRGFTGIQ